MGTKWKSRPSESTEYSLRSDADTTMWVIKRGMCIARSSINSSFSLGKESLSIIPSIHWPAVVFNEWMNECVNETNISNNVWKSIKTPQIANPLCVFSAPFLPFAMCLFSLSLNLTLGVCVFLSSAFFIVFIVSTLLNSHLLWREIGS